MLEIPLAHCVRGGMVLVAERKREKRRAAALIFRASAQFPAALLFSPLTPRVAHHSACDDRSWRNLLLLATNFPKSQYSRILFSIATIASRYSAAFSKSSSFTAFSISLRYAFFFFSNCSTLYIAKSSAATDCFFSF